jgi:hypothetical protein
MTPIDMELALLRLSENCWTRARLRCGRFPVCKMPLSG